MDLKAKEKILSKIYYQIDKPGSFGGLKNFWREIRSKTSLISKQDVQKWLQKQDTYTIHKKFSSSPKSRQLVVPHPDYLWQADLLDVRNLSQENNEIKYLLTCIDVFSKMAWAIPLKSKSATEVLNGIKLLTENNKPKYLQTDQGSEFFNFSLKSYLKEKDIKIYATKSSKKASVIERFNRTLREKIERYFTFSNSKKYIDILPDLIKGYNDTFHSSIKEKPINVSQKNAESIFKNLYGYEMSKGPDIELNGFKFKVKDKVRIVKYKTLFSKGSSPNWTHEIFTIDKIYPTIPPTYSIIDYNNDAILGEFYENELQKIDKDDEVYQVEYILKTTGRKPNRKFFVKWLGYPNAFNSWINEKDYDL